MNKILQSATDPRVTLQMRQATHMVSCNAPFTLGPEESLGKRRTTSSANESLVVLENNKDVVERRGTGYDEGLYNITQRLLAGHQGGTGPSRRSLHL